MTWRLSITFVALAMGCLGPTLSVTVSGEGTGTVTSDPHGIVCGDGCAMLADGPITLTATVAANSMFVGWSGDGCSGTEPCTLVLGADTTIEAEFGIVHHELTVTRSGAGAGIVSSEGIDCGADCSERLPHGRRIALAAEAAAGSSFLRWTGRCYDGPDTCIVMLTEGVTVDAMFVLDNSLVVTRSGAGTGQVSSSPAGIDCGTDCEEAYTPGTVVTLQAAADPGVRFRGWSGSCAGYNCTITLDRARMVTARFEPLAEHTLTVNRVGPLGGFVTSSPVGINCGTDCSAVFEENTAVTLTATSVAGSHFMGWGGACSGQITETCTTTITGATTVTATFAPQNIGATVIKLGNGTGLVSSSPSVISCGVACSGAVVQGTVLTLTATADASSIFVGWSGAGCSGTGNCVITVNDSVTVFATFALSQQGTLYAIRDSDRMVRRIDRTTLAATDVGPLGVGYGFGDCTWDPFADTLYMVDGYFGVKGLYRVSITTGAATLVGIHGIPKMTALGFHPPTGALYGIAGDTPQTLYRIDSGSGAATVIASLNVSANMDGLAWDSLRNRFVASSANIFGAGVFGIDVTTGIATALASTPGINNHGFTYDPVIDRHLAADTEGNLHEYDPGAGFTRTTLATDLGYHTCLALVP